MLVRQRREASILTGKGILDLDSVLLRRVFLNPMLLGSNVAAYEEHIIISSSRNLSFRDLDPGSTLMLQFSNSFLKLLATKRTWQKRCTTSCFPLESTFFFSCFGCLIEFFWILFLHAIFRGTREIVHMDFAASTLLIVK